MIHELSRTAMLKTILSYLTINPAARQTGGMLSTSYEEREHHLGLFWVKWWRRKGGTMPPEEKSTTATSACGLALLAGGLISAVDNLAFGGEVSPIMIVILLLAASAAFAFFLRHAWATALAVWIFTPLVHVAKHLAGIPDTIQPNTYASIAVLAIFTLIVSLAGAGIGAALRHAHSGSAGRGRMAG
jgi:hypothetical protein